MCVRQGAGSGPGDSLEASARLTLCAVIAWCRLNSYCLIMVFSEQRFSICFHFPFLLNSYRPTLCPVRPVMLWLAYVPFGAGLCLCLCLLFDVSAAASAVVLLYCCVVIRCLAHECISEVSSIDMEEFRWRTLPVP